MTRAYKAHAGRYSIILRIILVGDFKYYLAYDVEGTEGKNVLWFLGTTLLVDFDL